MELISLKDVVFGYQHTPILKDVSFTIDSGEFVGVTGPNGASKSTMLRVMLGLLKPWRGTIIVNKTNHEGKKLKIGYVPQQIASFNTGFPSTVLELVRSGQYEKGNWFKRLTVKHHQKVEDALKMVGMWEFRYHKIGDLSGGQKQKICIARVLASEPDVLVLDEPTTGMDVESRQAFYQFMDHQVKKHGRTVVMVTHEQDEVEKYLTKVIRLERGEKGGWKCLTWNSCSAHFGQEV
ncbi:metal ABC transporter ATP-binding protein [Priestia megaterium]|uniref:metal ABC transporter ATP-binding protein n=1 Tax=Priestia megaterium TaxID=1404 RepID=UPI00047146BB|nr:metal ABC transporter ATP-binding protein [Priestia megaterium]MDI3091254.1 metal ABC transporter ATP-binding protein [Priestia megaterium]MED3865887.1 metal ABC transporter ATP-binding protein [Priestia megaterium]MED3916235.1 metal ABC transporter ATP-binding protein [Priestia megaterium]MED4098685.1 metal ABC transporter ATP-binding protein [Priestia megaterium]MED4146173.1 metal ABC transporter ATP-binding protein [Priestia megaterium]